MPGTEEETGSKDPLQPVSMVSSQVLQQQGQIEGYWQLRDSFPRVLDTTFDEPHLWLAGKKYVNDKQ